MGSAADQSDPACPSSQAIEVMIEPRWDQWASALSTHSPSPARSEIGIPDDRPVLFSGHQPIVFHNGILAKLIAQHEGASRVGAQWVLYFCQYVPVELDQLRISQGQAEELSEQTLRILSPGSIPSGVPSASLPAMQTELIEDERLQTLVSYLDGYSYETSLARQFASATITLASEMLGIEPPQLIYASELFSSDTLWSIVERMLDDPESCVRAYNRAVAAHPDARVRPLTIEDDRNELPLWGLSEGKTRVAIDTANIDAFDRGNLAPRGLLMSLLVRLHLGELFIHGTGGWTYDQITQSWAHDWLRTQLNPMALTTATQHLDLGFNSDEVIELDRSIWNLHHARHTPSMLGDEITQQRKNELTASIEAEQMGGQARAGRYAQLQSLLENYRAAHQEGLNEMRGQIVRAREMKQQIKLANDRTWPFVLFGDDQLAQLKQAVVDTMH